MSLSSRFLHIPVAGSGGPGGGDPIAQILDSEVRLTVRHPIFDGLEYLASHNHTWLTTFQDNFVEAGSGIDYTQWRQIVGAEEVLIRYYDDDRKWWWQVPSALIEAHPNPNGFDITDGFQGSEDDTSCAVQGNNPDQQANSVINMNDAPDVLTICGGSDPFDPDFCSCGGEPRFLCALVATVAFLETGSSFHQVPPASQGVRKYAYDCTFIP